MNEHEQDVETTLSWGKLVCALCLFARRGQAPPADTIIGGVAVCVDHTSQVAGGDFGRMVQSVKAIEGAL